MIFQAILDRAPVSASRINPQLLPKLEEIITKALEKDRKLRYQNASDLRTDLQRLKRDTNSNRASVVAGTPERHLPWWRGKAALAASALVLIAILAVTAWFAFIRSHGETIDAVAVLPFVNATADPNTEYLSDGLTESLINNLSRLHNLRVVPRSSVFRYKGKNIDPRTAASELGVHAVLTGRVVQRGDNLAISTELIDTRDDRQLWGEQYNRKMTDLLTVQEDISRTISDKLRLQLSSEDKARLVKRFTEDPEAYQLYLKGRFYWNKRTAEGFKRGLEYFEQAIAKDPNYALAYSGVSDIYDSFGDFDIMPPAKAGRRRKRRQ